MKLNIWLILDGKRGHEKQIEDLAFSINKKIKTNITKIKKISFLNILLNFLRIGNDPCKYFPRPDLIIAAGHRTHFDALQKKNRYGGKIILIMKPSIPTFLFDLSIIPSHDKVFFKKNTMSIEGPLNNIKNLKKHKSNKGLILIGGPSKHFSWNNTDLIFKVKKIVLDNQDLDITLSTSRRTPDIFLEEIKKNIKKQLRIIDHKNVSSDWLQKSMSESKYSWVTQDSISMMFELIYSGSLVTCIDLNNRSYKFEKIYQDLYNNNRINFTNKKIKKIKPLSMDSSNADICASFIIKRFLN